MRAGMTLAFAAACLLDVQSFRGRCCILLLMTAVIFLSSWGSYAWAPQKLT